MIYPGEIYLADDPIAGRHPFIAVSGESLNRGDFVLGVVCTSARFASRSAYPNCVPFRAGEFGFTKDCVAQCENLLSIDKARLDVAGGPVGTLDEVALRDVVRAIGYVIEADCEPV